MERFKLDVSNFDEDKVRQIVVDLLENYNLIDMATDYDSSEINFLLVTFDGVLYSLRSHRNFDRYDLPQYDAEKLFNKKSNLINLI